MGRPGPTNTGGVKPMPIEGRLGNERQRLRGMSKEERAWRGQWIKDQELAPDEPRQVPQLRKELINPIRRFYQKPLDVACRSLVPYVGEFKAALLRSLIPKVLMGISAVYVAHYYFKYSKNDWTRSGGFAVHVAHTRSLPGDPDYPRVSEKVNPWDYADKGFKSRKVFLD